MAEFSGCAVRFFPLTYVLTLCAAGCDEAESGPGGPDVPLVATTEEVFTLGGVTLEEWQAFTEVSEVHFDGAGNLILVDKRQTRIVVVGPEARLRHRVSRLGDGPGELRMVAGVEVLSDNRLVVSDVGHNALLLFDANGEFVEQFAIDAGTRTSRSDGAMSQSIMTSFQAVPVLIGALPDDRLLMARRQARTFDIHTLGEGSEELYRAYDPSAGIAEGGGVSLRLGEMEVPLPAGLLPGMLAFGPPLLGEVLTDGRVVVVDSVGYQVKLLQPNGSLDAVLERRIEPVPVSPEMREAARERQLAGKGMRFIATGPGISDPEGAAVSTTLMESMVPQMEYASEVPVIKDLAVDSEDRIWVSRSGVDGTSRGPTDVFTANGEYLGTLAADEFRIPDAFGPDGLMAYIELGELDVPTVRVLRLVNLHTPAEG